MSKKRKNVESVVQVFTFLHFEIANEHFYCKTIHTCYVIHTKLFIFWLKYNDLADVRKTPKLIEGSHRDLQVYRHICYYLHVFYVFFKIQKVVTFYVFCHVSYVFSNYDLYCIKGALALFVLVSFSGYVC